MSEEPLFDVTLKKKKKKAVAFNEDPLGVDGGADTPTVNDDAAKASSGANATDSLGNDFSDLKKKKKKKLAFDVDAVDEPVAETSSAPLKSVLKTTDAPAATNGDDATGTIGDFSDMKKKKKSKKAAFDLEAFEKELEETTAKPNDGAEGDEDGEEGPAGAIDYDEEELGDDVFAAPAGGTGDSEAVETWHGTDRDYTYAELLGRIMRTLHAQNPELSASGRKRYTIVPPSVHREGNKKTIFANIAEICKRMHRQPEHVISFLFAELGTTGSVDGEKRLVIKGRFQPKQLENVLRRYIVEYVTCKTCKSPDSILTKENRLYFMTCESCGSKRSVSAIKTGFQAQIGKRKKKVA